MTETFIPTAEQVARFPRMIAAVQAGEKSAAALQRAVTLDSLEFTLRGYRAARLAGGQEFRINRNLIHVTAPTYRTWLHHLKEGN